MDEEIFEILRARLNLSDNASVDGEHTITDLSLPIMTDCIEDGDRIFFVEIKTRITFDTIARSVLFKELLQNQERKFESEPLFVIAGKVISESEKEIAEKVGVKLVQLPHRISLPRSDYGTADKIKITSDKSWKVITRLPKEKTTSIRKLALLEKVSYGWAHKTIQRLIFQGIVTRTDNYVNISDINKLLSGVAWERPFEKLRVEEITIDYDIAIRAAKDISYTLKNENIEFAFTSYTAGGLYTGYAVRYDAVYLYLEKNKINLFKDTFRTEKKKGVKARIYVPDRDVFSDKRELESIIATSPAQTLLDLAGLGYGGLDIAKAMVDNYARL